MIHLSWNNYRWISETLVGAATVCLIAAYARLLIQGTSKPLPFGLRLLSSRWATALGKFSYSIYLIHFPVIYTSDMILRTWHAAFPGPLHDALCRRRSAGRWAFLSVSFGVRAPLHERVREAEELTDSRRAHD